MATQSISVARIFIREGEQSLVKIMHFLHEESQVAGVTVFQGISGFGEDGKIRSSHLVDLCLDLPLVIEFYDHPERVVSIIQHLQEQLQIQHIISWQGKAHIA
jgi:uncharacterized protein